MRSQRGAILYESSDTELLSMLRGGETEAYTELWRRHIRAALRVARRLMPDRAEDLVSESFLAVYRQVAVMGNGPESAFRAYLFTTMRNTAFRWRKEASRIETDPELDSIELADALSTLEDRAQASRVLDAFTSLPERWQRILWLTEVEEAPRSQIAGELGIKPNAVSALYRRARTGLRLQWLTQQVPDELREDQQHIAHLLPRLVLDSASEPPSAQISEHLQHCSSCAELMLEMKATNAQMGRGTLAVVGFASLGVVLPAASQASIAAVGVGATAALLAVGGATLAVTLGVFTIGGTLPPSVSPAVSERSSAHSYEGADRSHDGDSNSSDAVAEEEGAGVDGSSGEIVTGRANPDSSIASLGFGLDSPPTYFYEVPARPVAAEPGSIPDPSDEPRNPQDSEAPAGEVEPDSAVTPQPSPGQGPPPVLLPVSEEPLEVEFGAPTSPTDPNRPPQQEPGTPHAPAVPVAQVGAGNPRGSAPPPVQDSPPPPVQSLTAPVLTTPALVEGYLAPVLAGTTAPGASIAVEIDLGVSNPDVRRYSVPVQANGQWSFDLRTLVDTRQGSYAYRVWAYTSEISSPSVTGAFTVGPPSVIGFESIAPFEPMPLSEANSTGIVFRAVGPANGEICLVSVWSGQYAILPLDEQGVTVRRIRMLTGGTYFLEFRVCDGDYRGPAAEFIFDVEDPDLPIFGPLGPDDSLTEFELEEVEEEVDFEG